MLLANPSAQVREETLDLIVQRAPGRPRWHAPLVERPTLPARLAAKIAAFVADALLLAPMSLAGSGLGATLFARYASVAYRKAAMATIGLLGLVMIVAGSGVNFANLP